MADEPDDQFNDNEGSETARQQGQQNPPAQQHGQQSGGQSGSPVTTASGQGDGTSGQPIGGNDSNTGSGTTLSQGADFGGQSSSGQTAADPNSETLTTDRQSESSTTGQNEDSSDEGFIGSQGSGSDEYLREGGGSDFAKGGRGALDEDENESDSGPGDGSGSSGTGGGSF